MKAGGKPNTSGYVGVTKLGKKFRARKWDGTEQKHVGLYATIEEAAEALGYDTEEDNGKRYQPVRRLWAQPFV